MDNKVKKDNLTDLISDLTKPVEAKHIDSKPVVEPPKDFIMDPIICTVPLD